MCKFNFQKNPQFLKSSLVFGVDTKGWLTQYHSPFIPPLSPSTIKVKYKFSQPPLQLGEHLMQYWLWKHNWRFPGAFVSS